MFDMRFKMSMSCIRLKFRFWETCSCLRLELSERASSPFFVVDARTQPHMSILAVFGVEDLTVIVCILNTFRIDG